MKCGECGAEGEGNYCARCGAPLGAAEAGSCPSCGASVGEEDLYCGACGEPLRERPEKSLTARLPWILSALALLAFAVAIALLVRGQAGPRAQDAPPTGGVLSGGGGRMSGEGPGAVAPPGEGADAARGAEGTDTGATGRGPAGGAGGAEGDMPTASELANMTPRQAGDRLFNRVMRMQASGDTARLAFFARMGLRAYGQVPPAEAGPDLRFHAGLLELARGAPSAAGARADSILQAVPGHLLGLYLAARSADAGGDASAARRWRDSLRAAAARTGLDARPEYRAHGALLEEVTGSG